MKQTCNDWMESLTLDSWEAEPDKIMQVAGGLREMVATFLGWAFGHQSLHAKPILWPRTLCKGTTVIRKLRQVDPGSVATMQSMAAGGRAWTPGTGRRHLQKTVLPTMRFLHLTAGHSRSCAISPCSHAVAKSWGYQMMKGHDQRWTKDGTTAPPSSSTSAICSWIRNWGGYGNPEAVPSSAV